MMYIYAIPIGNISISIRKGVFKMKIISKKTIAVILILTLIISSSVAVLADEIIARRKSTGEVVTQIQQRLSNLGYSCPVDGKYGRSTVNQVKLFQKANGLTVDGIVRQSVYNKLFSSDAVKYSDYYTSSLPSIDGVTPPKGNIIARLGSKGKVVTNIQSRLVELGYSTKVDGVFGKTTKAAVEAFQSANSLYVDGVVTQSVYNLLFSGTGKKYEDPSKSNGNVIARKNSKGTVVLNIQHRLKNLGFSVNTDGKFTNKTKSAVIAFQIANNLVADGVVYQSTFNLLFSSTAKGNTSSGGGSSTIIARKNSSGDVVLKIQQRLCVLGYHCKIDGKFGNGTANAVMLFQMINGLPVNGVIRNYDYSLLMSDAAKAKPATDFSGGNIIARKNSRGIIVQGIQLKLNSLGFKCNVDGIFGDKTVKAVKAFQKANGLYQDGIVRQGLYDLLFSGAPLTPLYKGTLPTGAVIAKRGSTGEVVLKIQQRLNALGYVLNADGIYGRNTEAVVRAFQVKNSLYPDGIVRQSVYDFMFSASAK